MQESKTPFDMLKDKIACLTDINYKIFCVNCTIDIISAAILTELDEPANCASSIDACSQLLDTIWQDISNLENDLQQTANLCKQAS